MSDFNRIAFVGLDGVPYSLLKTFFELSVTPGLKEIANAGTFVPMNSSLPPISSVAWTSFMTGVGPGQHGIFGFTDIEENQIKLKFPSFDDIKAPTIWSKYPDKKTIVVNLPFTYPARPLNGVLISGFVSPIFERSVQPTSLIPWLKSKNYKIDTDNVRARQDRNFLINDLFSTLRPLEEVVFSLSSEPWDLFILVVTGTDRLNHFLFDAIRNANHPLHEEVISYYRRIDNFVTAFLERLDIGTRKVILSDHGFTDLKIHVNLNRLLQSLGYLKFDSLDPQDISSVSPNSDAFAMDPTRIYLNSKTRFRNGKLSETQAAEKAVRIKNDLSRFMTSDLGPVFKSSCRDFIDEPVFEQLLSKEDVYQGPWSEIAPDIIVIPSRGYDIKASVNAKVLCHSDIFTGTHTHNDAFIMIGDKQPGVDMSDFEISKVAGLIPWNHSIS
ncbi:MAG: alkaline phosphatase family protein [Pseudomonadota bacterium]